MPAVISMSTYIMLQQLSQWNSVDGYQQPISQRPDKAAGRRGGPLMDLYVADFQSTGHNGASIDSRSVISGVDNP